jgi:RNA polymerase sigma-70 factor (ECF subfamily)
MMLKKESEQEIREIYEKYASLVHNRCLSFLKSEDEAWDATQEVFMKLMESLSSIKKKGSMLSWLYKTATNHCISQLRKKPGLEFDEEIHSQASDRTEQDKAMILKEIMVRLFRPWDKKTRDVVIYSYIARLTGMGESTIRRHLTRFRRKSAELIEDEGQAYEM